MKRATRPPISRRSTRTRCSPSPATCWDRSESMSQGTDPRDRLRETLARSLGEIERLRASVAALEASASEPLALVGLGLRLPGGVVDLEGLWELLARGVDVVGPIPADRFERDGVFDPDPDAAGKSYV